MATKSNSKKTSTKKTSETRWDEQWEKQYENLVRYHAKNKKSWPSTLEEFPKGNRIGQWVLRQRELKNRKALTPARIALLDKIDFAWEKQDERSSHWDTQIQYLKEYRKANPDSWPFAREEFPKGNRLGLWVWRQRQNFARKNLSKDRLNDLKSVNFQLELPDNWEMHLKTLKEYRAKHSGQWPKAREEYPAGNRLGLWCHLQRCAQKVGTLQAERVAKLEKIGFQWSVKNLGWMKYFEQVKEYKKKNAAKWPSIEAGAVSDKKLISWASAQRHKKKNKQLDKEKFTLLDKIGFRW